MKKAGKVLKIQAFLAFLRKKVKICNSKDFHILAHHGK